MLTELGAEGRCRAKPVLIAVYSAAIPLILNVTGRWTVPLTGPDKLSGAYITVPEMSSLQSCASRLKQSHSQGSPIPAPSAGRTSDGYNIIRMARPIPQRPSGCHCTTDHC